MRWLLVVAVLAAGCKKEAPAAKDAAVAAAAPARSQDAATIAKVAPPADAAPVAKVAPAADAAPIAKVAPDPGNDGPAAMPTDWWTTGCPKVLLAISRCAGDQGFVDALTAGTDKADHKLILGRIADLKGTDRPDSGNPKSDRAHEECGELPSVAFEDPGFLDSDWRELAAPDVLADCAKLGAAIKESGGLFGGSVDE